MIAAIIVDDVCRLLAEGTLSQRKIARLTGVSRGSVGAIASGKRPAYETPPKEEDEEPTGPPQRCLNCGGMAYMPCRLCRTQKTIVKTRQSTLRHKTMDMIALLELNLRPEHRARYEEVRTWREQDAMGQIAGVP